MYKSFVKYFFGYIIHTKSRQRLLIMAAVGLVLSSFALLVVQSTMGGLQKKLIGRSKDVTGNYVAHLKNLNHSDALKLTDRFKKAGVSFTLEYEIELLMRHFNYITPVVLHGVSKLSHGHERFTKYAQMNLVLPYDISYKLMAERDSFIKVISPSHVDDLLGEIPRMIEIPVEKIVTTNVPEVDALHAWVNVRKVQNLIRKRVYNRLRVFSTMPLSELSKLLPANTKVVTWDERNRTLLYSLKLESLMMVFLFTCMSILVSFCITSGLMIFFNKVKKDMASFWILGSSDQKITKGINYFVNSVGFSAVLSGIVFGVIFLLLFDKFGGDIMPEVFVDRKIPVHITMKGLLLSFCIPFSISLIFSKFVVHRITKDQDYLDYVRSTGQS